MTIQRSIVWGVGGFVASLGLVWALRAQEQQSIVKPPAPSAAATADRVVFQFSDEAQMRQFGQLWQQRQAVLGRLSMLQDYLDQEQAGLTYVNQKLWSQYHLDVSKPYVLDTDRRVLVEQDALAPASAGSLAAPASSSGTPAPTP